ncbi:BREX system serine/threonine kinase PglW [Kitasatospora purpeofusca]|uniref:BREX system serine/threonine kinase PglW n=1 Tax=Kitasatospora purpeofusca TaxID=67352 RepID=UPI00325641EA
MEDDRWTTVTDSEFEHERRGLSAIRRQLPNADPWRAWSNFTFTAHSGHVREVDLLVVTPGGVHLIELKDWHGSVESRNGTWLQTQPSGRQVAHSNPLHLANKKAKELAGLLSQSAGPQDRKRWWVSEAVCFTDSSLDVRLPSHDRNGIFDVKGLVEHLSRPPRDEASRIKGVDSAQLTRLLARIGIARSNAEYRVGPYRLDRKAFDSGPTWADYLGHHADLQEVARVRIYLRERGADQSLQESVERAARREAAVLTGFRHPGVVQLAQYDASGHSAGPALIFKYDQRTLRLDEYMAQYGEKLDLPARVALVRQLAETVRSAHSRRLYHRTLSARAVHVVPVRRTPGASEDAAWLTPRLQLSDWQVALRSGSASQGGTAALERAGLAPTRASHLGQHLSEAADPYLAPELTVRDADPISLDVYGLGVLTYLLVTGQAPASSQAELEAKLEQDEGLRPGAVKDGVPQDLDLLVDCATAYDPQRRLATVDEFLELLEDVESAITEPTAGTGSAGHEAEEQSAADAGTGLTHTKPEPGPEPDPLEAVAGQVLAGRWEVLRRIGTGSTSRAFLVRDLTVEEEGKTRSLAVLKIALSDNRAAVLRREAESMSLLRPDSRVIRLKVPEPVLIGGRTVLVLEYVGDERAALEGKSKQETVARQLREQGRLTIDQLDAYGDYLFGAVDFLEGEGVWHRDIKPDNIAIRVRPNRTRELVLIDFSLANLDVKEVEAGTEGYLDPFIGTLTRSVYDAHAERYAVAVTLHEMASAELPVWGDGRSLPRQTDPIAFPTARVAADAFDPQVRDALIAFFAQALHRDVAKRFSDLKPMRDAWKRIFLALDEVRPSSRTRHADPSAPTGPEQQTVAEGGTSADASVTEAEPESVSDHRNALAAKVTSGTLLDLSGLSPAAVSFVHGLGLTTVQDLLDLSQRGLVNKPGLGAKTRRELQDRMKQWRLALAQQPAAPLGAEGREAADAELSELEAEVARLAVTSGADPSTFSTQTLRRFSLDILATLFVPELNKQGSNHNTVDTVRLLLRLPGENGELPGGHAWPRQSDFYQQVGITQGRVAQIVSEQRRRWAKHPAIEQVRAEVIELLAGLGRVASAVEIADALAVRRGTQLQDKRHRRALALAAVRVAVEIDQLKRDDKAIAHLANRDAADDVLGAGLLALEYREAVDAPDTPSAPGLLDYAARLGKVADRLARSETLPTSGTVLTELSAVAQPSGNVPEWDERRMVMLAAAASQRAAATPRLEIYPRDLSLVRALRITQAGVVRWVPELPAELQPGLTAADVHRHVRARFPELTAELPEGGALSKALVEAGFDLVLGVREGSRQERYIPRPMDGRTTGATFMTVVPGRGSGRSSSRPATTQLYSDNPEERLQARADQQLADARERDGFRVLTVRTQVAGAAREALVREYGVEPVSAAGFFLAALHEQVDPRPRPTWETILRADVAPAGTTARMKFGEYAVTAWGTAEARLTELVRTGDRSPLLVTDAAVFARYDAMGVLHRLAEWARQGRRGLWLLCPQSDATAPPHFGATVVPYQAGLNEWVKLNDAWVNEKKMPATPATANVNGTGDSQ